MSARGLLAEAGRPQPAKACCSLEDEEATPFMRSSVTSTHFERSVSQISTTTSDSGQSDDDSGSRDPTANSGEMNRESLAPADGKPAFCGIPLKWISLVAVVAQTSASVLLIKWSKAKHRDVNYLNSTVIFFTEVVKMVVSILFVMIENSGLSNGAAKLLVEFKKCDTLKAAVPSLIYSFQNNLTFFSLEYLSAGEMQVLYQMKVLTTAGLSVLVLGKVLTATQWLACMMLVVGIAVVQWPHGDDAALGTSSSFAQAFSSGKMKGFLAVLAGCITKAFASVFIEKLFTQTEATVWMRNVQFGFFGAIVSAGIVLVENGSEVMEDGFIQGYDERVVVVILANATGGLLVGAMLKYAGATLGCFSTALSIILTSIISMAVLRDSRTDVNFVVGTTVTISSAFLYELGLPHCATPSG